MPSSLKEERPQLPPHASRVEHARIIGRRFGYVACALAGCCWGTGFFFGKIAFSRLGVGHYVLYRFLFACIGMLPIVETPRFSRREWTLLLIGAFLGIPLQFLVQFQGLKLTTVSHAALMVGTMPVILAVGATLFAHERLDLKGWLALLGSTAGIVLIVLSASHGGIHGGNLWGDLLVVASLVIALGWVLINQRLMAQGCSPSAVSSWTLLTGAAMLFPWVLSATDSLRCVGSAGTSGSPSPPAACSAPPLPRCCGTGASIASPPRAPGSSSTSNPRLGRSSASWFSASGSVPARGSGERSLSPPPSCSPPPATRNPKSS